MAPFSGVRTSGYVHRRVTVRLGAFLAVPVLLVLLIRGGAAVPVLAGAALTAVTAAGSATHRRVWGRRS